MAFCQCLYLKKCRRVVAVDISDNLLNRYNTDQYLGNVKIRSNVLDFILQITYGSPSANFAKRVMNEPNYAPATQYTRVLALAGGMPIKAGTR